MAGLTIKQEAFCQRYIETGNASEAYRQAYDAENMKPESIHRKAKELLDNGKVAARVAEMKAQTAEAFDINLQGLLVRLQRAFTVGELRGQSSGMTAAVMAMAKLAGLDKDGGEGSDTAQPVKVEVTVTDARKRAEP